MDVADADKIVWSPNNEYLLFRGRIGRRLICGLWRYRISDKTLALIKEVVCRLYLDHEREIVGIKYTNNTYSVTEIWEYTITE